MPEHGIPETNRYINLLKSAAPGEVLQPRTSMSLDDWLSDPIFRKFLRPDGLGDGLTCPLFQSEGGFVAVATFRNSHYHQEHIDILRATAPHLRHALKVHLRLNSRDDSEAGLLALDHLRVGVLLSDAQGRMIWMNSAAEKILQEADGLSTGSAGFLLAARADETNRLRHFIRLAADHAPAQRLASRSGDRSSCCGGPDQAIAIVRGRSARTGRGASAKTSVLPRGRYSSSSICHDLHI
jgi:PAS domain-containing protein